MRAASDLSHYGVEISQEEIVRATYGRLVDLPAYTPRQLYSVLNGFRIDGRGTVEVRSGDFGQGAPAPAWLVDQLRRDHPVIAWYVRPGRGGHAVVITGVEYSGSRSAPIIERIDYFDPWPGAGRSSVGGHQLASAMVSHFAVRAARLVNGNDLDDDEDDGRSCRETCRAERSECREAIDDDCACGSRARRCNCPNWPPGNFKCHDVCQDCYERSKECEREARSERRRCSSKYDRCKRGCD